MSEAKAESNDQFDAIVVGAGFAGLYLLHRLRKMGLRVRVFEAADGVGGTWYWNRYPGARCDAESMAYSYSFSEELEQEWQWTERYPTQPEILKYIEHVADRFDLMPDVQLNTRVTSAHYDDDANIWNVVTDAGDQVSAQFCILATGCLSVPQLPDIAGLDDFSGPVYQTSVWPHEGVDFNGQRVGVIGTGSSAIQAIPVIAAQAEHLTVFQRTANFSIPAWNGPLNPQWVSDFKAEYPQYRQEFRLGNISGFGDLSLSDADRGVQCERADSLSAAELEQMFEKYWQVGGTMLLRIVADVLVDEASNAKAAEFVRGKIREIVKDPAVAEMLCPNSHPIGTKRICVDTDYYKTFNRSNVSLVDVASSPIQSITSHGLQTAGSDYEFDTLVLATGFDAMTGALLNMDIRGANDQTLAGKWQEGPRSYLGLCVSGFPNLFTITGPGSPSVLSNMLISIEQHVDWVVDSIDHMRERGLQRLEAEQDAEDRWVDHVNEVANATLLPKGGSWYLGANVPGKPRVFMPYAAGVGAYRQICDRVTANGYEGFSLT
jgi:cyclohexanone monooxygenase